MIFIDWNYQRSNKRDKKLFIALIVVNLDNNND